MLRAVGTDELWPHAVGTFIYFTLENNYVEPHTSPIGSKQPFYSIANFELLFIGHDLSIPTGHKIYQGSKKKTLESHQ
jgi:hypothetical protein